MKLLALKGRVLGADFHKKGRGNFIGLDRYDLSADRQAEVGTLHNFCLSALPFSRPPADLRAGEQAGASRNYLEGGIRWNTKSGEI